MKEGDILKTTAHFSLVIFELYKGSRTAMSSVKVRDAARVVGMFKKDIASLHKYSRIEDRSTALPSANLEKGVVPLPFN